MLSHRLSPSIIITHPLSTSLPFDAKWKGTSGGHEAMAFLEAR